LLTLLRDESFEIPSPFISERRRNNVGNNHTSAYPAIDQLLSEIQYYQRLDKVGEAEFRKLSSAEQERRVNMRITEMMLSEHRTTYQSWPKDLLREHATYQVKKEMASKFVTKH